MVMVQIGQEERTYGEADERWVSQQIAKRKADGESVCVRVTIRENDAELNLATPTCGGGGGGGRAPSARENEIIAEWRKHNLDQSEFAGGNLVAFLKALKRLLDV